MKSVAKIEILAQWLEKHNIHIVIKDRAKLKALLKACPEDAPIIEVFKGLLESIAPQQQQDLTPTQLALATDGYPRMPDKSNRCQSNAGVVGIAVQARKIQSVCAKINNRRARKEV